MRLEDIQKSACAKLNQHLFNGTVKQVRKYGNKKVELDGITFDSKKEARRYAELKLLQSVGEIAELKLQVPFQLSVCKYIADFTYITEGRLIVEDVKSKATKKLSTYRIKKKMMLAELGIEIIEI